MDIHTMISLLILISIGCTLYRLIRMPNSRSDWQPSMLLIVGILLNKFTPFTWIAVGLVLACCVLEINGIYKDKKTAQ